MTIVWQHIQKILMLLTAVVGAVVSFAAGGGLNQVIGAHELQLLGLLNVVLGAAAAALNHGESSKAKVADAVNAALQSTPPPKQGGFVRFIMLAFVLAIAVPVFLALPGCITGTEARQLQELPIRSRIQLGYDTLAEVTRDVDASLASGQISKRAAADYLQLADDSKAALDTALEFSGTDVTTAEGKLRLAQKILTRLQADLISRGAQQ